MTSQPDLTADDKATLAALLRETIASDRFPMSPRIRELKAILAKVKPVKASAVNYPPPKASAVLSLTMGKKRRRNLVIAPNALRE